MKALYEVSAQAKARTLACLDGPLSEDSVSALFDDLIGMAERCAEDLAATARRDEAPACKSGCSACCCLRVPVSSLEVLYLVTKLREALDEDAARHLADRADRIAREVDGLSIGERALRRIPCPLLQDDRCTAYDWRPLECRGYGSFDADACRGLLDDFDTWPPPIPMARYAAFKNVQAGLMAALAEANHPVQILDLALAVRIGLRVENARDDWWQSESALEDAAISPWDMDSLSLLPGTPPV